MQVIHHRRVKTTTTATFITCEFSSSYAPSSSPWENERLYCLTMEIIHNICLRRWTVLLPGDCYCCLFLKQINLGQNRACLIDHVQKLTSDANITKSKKSKPWCAFFIDIITKQEVLKNENVLWYMVTTHRIWIHVDVKEAVVVTIKSLSHDNVDAHPSS